MKQWGGGAEKGRERQRKGGLVQRRKERKREKRGIQRKEGENMRKGSREVETLDKKRKRKHFALELPDFVDVQ